MAANLRRNLWRQRRLHGRPHGEFAGGEITRITTTFERKTRHLIGSSGLLDLLLFVSISVQGTY